MSLHIKEWEPFLIASDLHGAHQDRKVVREFLKFRDRWKPKHRFSLGDDWDITALRRGATEDEKDTPLRYDINLGLEFLKDFAPQVKINGNHCHRLWRRAAGTGLVSELCQKLALEIEEKLAAQKCRLIQYGKRNFHQFGDVKLLHGIAGGVGAARKHATHFGRCIFGHIHTRDIATFGRVEQSVTAYSCPALCLLDADYNAGHLETLRQENGWVYGVINKRTGKTNIHQHVIGDILL
jgi:hypothetical protein